MNVVTRPPSQLRTLESRLHEALPLGLPPALQRFYMEGDGLTVGGEGASATIVGLRAMFGDCFKTHTPVTRQPRELGNGPFGDRFIPDDFDFEAPNAIEDYNRRSRLKLLCAAEGESVDLVIDLFDNNEPTLYCVHEGWHVLRLEDLSFDDFVAWFTKFGTARWYFAFLELAADERLNIHIAAEFEASMASFPATELEPLRERVASRTQALADRQTQQAAAEQTAAEQAEPEASDSTSATRRATAEVEAAAERATFVLAHLTQSGAAALVAGISSGALPPQTAWCFETGLRVLPPELLPSVLTSPRMRSQDKNFWARVDQFAGVTVPAGVKLSKYLNDVVAVHTFLRGETARVPAVVTERMRDWLCHPPMLTEFPGASVDRGRVGPDHLRSEYKRLLALGKLLVGEETLRSAVEEEFLKSKHSTNPYSAAGLLLAAEGIDIGDFREIARKTLNRHLLVELATIKGWSREDVTQQVVHAASGLGKENLAWLSNNL